VTIPGAMHDKLRSTAAALILCISALMLIVGDQNSNQWFGPILRDLGTFVGATVLVGFLYEYYARKQQTLDTQRSLENALSGPALAAVFEARDKIAAEEISRLLSGWLDSAIMDAAPHGLQGFTNSIDYGALFDNLGSGDELLWLNNYCPDKASYVGRLEDAVIRGASVKMLLIEPGCANMALRAGEITGYGYFQQRMTQEVQGEIDLLTSTASKLKENPVAIGSLECRTFDGLPGLPMYIFVSKGLPTHGLTSFYLTEPSKMMPHLRWISRPSGMLASFHQYYAKKWDQSRANCFAAFNVSSTPPTQRTANP
jgi:hypothetical protein